MKLSRSAALFLASLTAALGGCGAFPQECFRAIECVRVCGGPVVSSGCAACGDGTFDNFVCRADASDANADATTDAVDSSPTDANPLDVTPTDTNPSDVVPTDVTPTDAQPFSCGSQTCGANQICVMPCSGIDSGVPLVPYCVDAPAGCGSTPTCGCISPGICPPASPPFSGCRQDSDRHFTCMGCA